MSKGLFGFLKTITHHSLFITQFSSLITHHLKYLNFLYPSVWHIFSIHITQIFQPFYGTHTWLLTQIFPIPKHSSLFLSVHPFSSSLISSKKIKAQKIKAKSKAPVCGCARSVSKLQRPSRARLTRRRSTSRATPISTWPTCLTAATSVFQWSLSLTSPSRSSNQALR